MAKSKKFTSDDAPLVANPFAQLLGDGTSEESEARVEPVAAESKVTKGEPASTSTKGRRNKVVVRREKKGRGGKTVTMIDGLPEPVALKILPRLKRELGCSGKHEGRCLVIGTRDHERVKRWLDTAGVTRTVLGN